MKLKSGTRTIDVRFEYVPADERLVLRTDQAFLSPADTERLKLELGEFTSSERELLSSSGYAWLTRARAGQPASH